MATSSNLTEELSRQVERVTIIRERYRAIEGEQFQASAGDSRITLNVNCSPAIALMTDILEAAHLAAASGDALAIIHVVEELRKFEE